MAVVFDDILLRGIRQGQIPARTQDARNWFRDKARTTRNINAYPQSILDDDKGQSSVSSGRMYHFRYDPKMKKELPYYDRFPLIFMVQETKGGFYGINLHYLPPKLRAVLMDALYKISNNRRYDESTKLRISYDTLKSAARFRYFKPTFKKYLNEHVRSQFIEIKSVEWDIALFLPTERFEKASKSRVFADSRKMLR
jgi:hypothetical protein